jgi:hypothetical protein
VKRKLAGLVTLSVGVSALFQACLVPDKQLVDELPSESGAGVGARGGSDSSNGAEAGAGEVSDGGTGTAGGSANAGKGGSGNAGSSGSGVAGSEVTVGGAPAAYHGACGGDLFLFCDDFEQDNGGWPASGQWTRESTDDAPSGNHVMVTGFHAVPTDFQEAAFSLSFWVRFGSLADQAFVTWPTPVGDLYFGLEASVFRFRLGATPPEVAPELTKYTRSAVVDTWTCVEIIVDANEARASVLVADQQSVELAVLGGAPDAGIDQKLLQAIPGGHVDYASGKWSLGEAGTSVQIDDVRLGQPNQPTVCQEHLAAHP